MEAWMTEPPTWKGKLLHLLVDGSVKPIPSPPLTELINRSKKFPVKFPIDTIKCETIQKSDGRTTLQRNIDSAYPLLHESVLHLYAQFLGFKCEHGSVIEKKLYKNMNVLEFVQRLLTKKAVFFAGPHDCYRLFTGPEAAGGWEDVGTVNETTPLHLEHWLSYDEMKLSALLSISSYSYFTNDGSRGAHGVAAICRDDIQPEGVIVSIIGTRLHKTGYMEYQDLVISRTQNYAPIANGTIRKLWSDFYGETPLVHKEVERKYKKGDKRYVKIWSGDYFDDVVFAKRIIVSFDTLLFEANQRAKQVDKMAYVYVVGIGLGVWRISTHQPQMFADVFADRLNVLGPKLSHISDVHLAYISSVDICGKYKSQDVITIPGHPTGIQVHISNREPFVKLSDPEKLLVVSYAADANSMPGNEFWVGGLTNSSDSTTASSTQVSELHNPHINRRINVGNLNVVTCEGPLVSIQEYVEKIRRSSR